MLISFLRAVVLYLVLIAAVRLMGKRQLGELEPAEFVVTILIANLASVPMQDTGTPMLSGFVPILTVLALELILSILSMRCRRLRRILTGGPIMLVEDGKILPENLAKTRITVDELLQHLREEQVLDIEEAQFAVLEVDGHITVIRRPEYEPPSAMDLHVPGDEAELPLTVISDGVVLEEYLAASGHDRAWLDRQLRQHGCRAEEVFLMTATKKGRVYLSRREERT